MFMQWKRIFLVMGLAAILACVCFAAANADELTFSQTTAAHGSTVVISYDLSNYTFDAAELVPMANCYNPNGPEHGRYEFDRIPLSGKKGTVSFSETNLGERISFEIALKVSDGTNDQAHWPWSDFFYGGEVVLSGAWNQPVFPELQVQYLQTSVQAGNPISASYQISAGSSPITSCRLGWNVYDDEGWANSAMSYENMPVSGTLTLNAPTMKARHYVAAAVETGDGWIYELEDTLTGVEVTTDGTGTPISIDLSWSDEQGNALDWSKDKAKLNQRIYMSWVMHGGYTPYEGYLNLTPVSGDTNFGSMGYAGVSRTLDFVMQGTTDLVLSVEYHDNHGNSDTFLVTIPAAGVPDIQLTNPRPDHNIYLGMPVYYGGLGSDGDLTFGLVEGVEAEIANFNELQQVLGGSEPAWTASLPANAPFTYDESTWNGSYTLFPSMDMPAQPMDVPIVITCAWGGKSASTTVTLHYVELPNRIAPTDNDYPTVKRLKKGDKLIISPDTVPSGWQIPGYTNRVVLFDEQMNAFAEKDAASTNQQAVYTVKKAGTFPAAVLLGSDTVYMGHYVFFYVEDDDGTVPPAELELGSWNGPERNYYLCDDLVLTHGCPTDIPYSDPFVDRFYITYDEQFKEILSGDPVWTVTADQNINFTWKNIRAMYDPDCWNMDIELGSLPAPGTNVTFHVECTWGDARGETDLTVHFKKISRPWELYSERIGVRYPVPSFLAVRTGESLAAIDWMVLTNFKEVLDHEEKGMWYDEGEEDNGSPYTDGVGGDRHAAQPGDYHIKLSASAVNINFTKACHLIVLRADGTLPKNEFTSQGGGRMTMPAALTRIEDSAFEGTAANIAVLNENCTGIGDKAFANSALREIDIPAGVTSIADNAFSQCEGIDGSGVIAIYAHSQTAIDYAVNHGFIALTDQ